MSAGLRASPRHRRAGGRAPWRRQHGLDLSASEKGCRQVGHGDTGLHPHLLPGFTLIGRQQARIPTQQRPWPCDGTHVSSRAGWVLAGLHLVSHCTQDGLNGPRGVDDHLSDLFLRDTETQLVEDFPAEAAGAALRPEAQRGRSPRAEPLDWGAFRAPCPQRPGAISFPVTPRGSWDTVGCVFRSAESQAHCRLPREHSSS